LPTILDYGRRGVAIFHYPIDASLQASITEQIDGGVGFVGGALAL
jgi:hypothetical protein